MYNMSVRVIAETASVPGAVATGTLTVPLFQHICRDFNEFPALHDAVDLACIFDVEERIVIEDDEICNFPLFQSSQLVLAPHDRRGIFRGRNQDVGGAEAGLDHQ